MSARVLPHIVEDISKSYISSKINESEIALYREFTGRDYGIDAIVEIFEKGMPTGKIAFLQIKGTDKLIIPLSKNPDVVSCHNVSDSNLHYALQYNIPVILIYVYLKGDKGFYYTTLNNSNNEEEILRKIKEQKTITIHIPTSSHSTGKMTDFFECINKFYGI